MSCKSCPNLGENSQCSGQQHMNSFNLPNSPRRSFHYDSSDEKVKRITLQSYKWDNGGTERLSNCPKHTARKGRARVRTQLVQLCRGPSWSSHNCLDPLRCLQTSSLPSLANGDGETQRSPGTERAGSRLVRGRLSVKAGVHSLSGHGL